MVFALLAMAAAVACGPAVPPGEESPVATDTDVESDEEAPAGETAAVPTNAPAGEFEIYGGASESEIVTTDSGLQMITTVEGDGPLPQAGEVVTVQYTGWLTDGTKFDSSVDRNQPFSFALGLGGVIPGWDEGVALMNQGSSARLVIPAELGYGASGASGVIPPNATLVFDVQLLDIHAPAPESPTAVDEGDYEQTEGGVKVFDIVEGSGAELTTGQIATVHYTGWLEDGTRFDSSLLSGQAPSFSFGSGQPILGWDEGLAGMKVGGVRQIVVPPELAFGEQGAGGGMIPPNATLVFEIELLNAE
jgi:peptidylprolyl isomerase